MKKIKRLINCVITDTVCNLDCEYCYVGQMEQHVRVSTKNIHSVEEMQRALSIKRLGGCCHLNICATGETLLVENIVNIVKAFLEEGHVVSVVTNCLISNRIDEICRFSDELLKYLFIKISFHYCELKRINKLDTFWQNVKKIKKRNISFTIELTVNDTSIPYIEDIKKETKDNCGAECHVIESRCQDDNVWPRLTKLPIKEHQKIWGSFNSDLFDFQQSIWGEKRKEFCYAGDWISSINLKTGEVLPCFGGGQCIDNIYTNMENDINFTAIGHNCPWGHCYAAYVLLSHGAIPNFTNVTYAQIRDRVCEDGTHWLQPQLYKIFSGKLSEQNKEYSELRELSTDFTMSVIYNNEFADNKFVELLANYFEKNDVKKVAIYGAGKLGLKTFYLLLKCKVNVLFFMDLKYETLNTPVRCISPNTIVENVDMIIITILREYFSIKESLKKCGNEMLIRCIANITED